MAFALVPLVLGGLVALGRAGTGPAEIAPSSTELPRPGALATWPGAKTHVPPSAEPAASSTPSASAPSRKLAELAKPPPGRQSKVHPELAALASGGERSPLADQLGTGAGPDGDGYIAVQAVARTSGDELLSELREIGLVDGLADERTVT